MNLGSATVAPFVVTLSPLSPLMLAAPSSRMASAGQLAWIERKSAEGGMGVIRPLMNFAPVIGTYVMVGRSVNLVDPPSVSSVPPMLPPSGMVRPPVPPFSMV